MKKFKFKRDYIPVYISFVMLLILIGTLAYMVLYVDDSIKYDQYSNFSTEKDIIVDNSGSKCKTKELKELYDKAKLIHVEYEVKKEEVEYPSEDDENKKYKVTKDVVYIVLKDLNKDLNLKITNDYNDEVIEVKEKDIKNGEYSFKTSVIAAKIIYTMDIISNKYSCKGETIRKFTAESKVYNGLSDSEACALYPEYEYCGKYYDEEIDITKFWQGLSVYKKKHPNINDLSLTPELREKAKQNSTTKVAEKNKSKESEKKAKVGKNEIIVGSVAILFVVIFIVMLFAFKRKKYEKA